MRIPRYRVAALLLLVIHVNACTTFQPVSPESSRQFIEVRQPPVIRVEHDGRTIVMHDPRIRNDSILGIVKAAATCARSAFGAASCVQTETREAAPLDQVHAIEARRFSPGRTFMWVTAVSAMVLWVAFGPICTGSPPEQGRFDPCLFR